MARLGGRYSTKHDVHWQKELHDGPSKLIIGAALGGVSASVTYAVGAAYGALEDLSVWASYTPSFLCIFISGTTLLFVALGKPVIITHQATLPAGYALCSALAAGAEANTAFLWSVAFGVLAVFMADFFGDTLYMWGTTHVCPAATTHLATSCILFNLPSRVFLRIGIPIILLVILVILAFTLYKPCETAGKPEPQMQTQAE